MARANTPGNPFNLQPTQTGPPELDNSIVNDTLKTFGVHMPSSYAQPGLEATPWGQRHNRLATGIDNAMIAVAGMGPTGETAGDNISNVARGVMGIQPFREQFADAQAQVPLQYAKEIGGLQGMQAENRMRDAQASWYGDRGQAALQANLTRSQIAQQNAVLKLQIESQKDPMVMNVPDPNNPGKFVKQVGRYQAELSSEGAPTGRGNYVPDPSINLQDFEQEKHMRGLGSIFGSDTHGEGTFIMTQMGKTLGGIDKINPDVNKWDVTHTDAFAKAVQYYSKLTHADPMAARNGAADRARDVADRAYYTKADSDLTSDARFSAPTKTELDNANLKAMQSAAGDMNSKISAGDSAMKALQDSKIKNLAEARKQLGLAFFHYNHLAPEERDQFGNFGIYNSMTQGGQAKAPPAAGLVNPYRTPKP